jgi:copper homeostasis protein
MTGLTARPALEVIATSVADAVAAEQGGADRLEVLQAIETKGLTPDVEEFARLRAAVSLPLRVMLRTNEGFEIGPKELEGLCREAEALRRVGADQFVLGFLTPAGTLDLAAINRLLSVIAPCRWTLHHAFDHAADQRAAWEMIAAQDGPDLVLTGGVRGDLAIGLEALCARAGWQTEARRWLAGGQLTLEQIPRLWAAGIEQFHAGRAARVDGSWDRPVDLAAVRALRRAVWDE